MSVRRPGAIAAGYARQSKMERRPFVHFGLKPDFAAVQLDDPLRRRQADARALKFLRPVQPLKNAENLVGIPHVNPPRCRG